MKSHWGMVDRLCRELRHLRDEARATPRGTQAAVIAKIDAALARAADALDATIESPEERHLFLGACAAVAMARARIREREAAGTLIEGGPRSPERKSHVLAPTGTYDARGASRPFPG